MDIVLLTIMNILRMPILKQLLRVIPFLLLTVTISGQQLKAVQQIEGIPPRVEYRAITHDGSGNIYVATSVDVFMIPANNNRAQPMSVGDQIVDVDWSSEHGLVLLSRDGTIRFTATGNTLSLDSGTVATCMDLTKSTLWVGTLKGVYTLLIPQNKVQNHFTIEDGVLLSNEINFIHIDPFNIRWIGTKAGVVRIEGKKWKLYEEDQAITAITSTSEGAWMAAEDNMWLVSQFNRWYEIDAWRNLVVGNVKALSSDSKGIIYIASEILVKYDPYQEKVITMNEGGAMDQLIILSQGPGKNVWMAGNNGMSRVVEDTTTITVVTAGGMSVAVEVKSNPVCTGMATGQLLVKVQGGTPPYSYKWSQAGNISAEAANLAPGLYQVTVTDLAGKSILASGIIPSSPPLRAFTAVSTKPTDILAANGKAITTIKGGVEPIQYLWSNGETKAQATTLMEGTYTVTVTDANGCIATSAVVMEAEKVLKSLDIATITLGQTIRVDKLYFEADSATIKPASFAVLEEIYTFLSENDNVVIEVGGHTNSLPEDAYCDKLSTSRAKNVAGYLYEKGIPESRISFKGYGKRQPIASNQTVDGRRKNQRVEIKIVSL
jgi:outer membrane protein OmpA-like peptidoglycan-associated protein